MSNLLDLTEAVVKEINASFNLPQPATRQNIPRNKAEELTDIRVTVRPKDRVTSRAARGVIQDVMRVYVGIQKQCITGENDESDPLIDLGESIQGYFDRKRPLPYFRGVICEDSSFGADGDSTWMSVIDQNALLVYTGLVVLTFRMMRQGACNQ